MINYNSKEWFSFIFQFHKADTISRLKGPLYVLVLYSIGVNYFTNHFFELGKDHELKNLTVIHTLLGFVISMLLVFRTNTAYDRWWEARKLWGSLVNSSRNLAIKLSSFLHLLPEEDRAYFRHMIPNFAFTLRNHLRKTTENADFDETKGFNTELISTGKHRPNQVHLAMMQRLQMHYEKHHLTNQHMLMLATEMQNFADVCGACERIRNTPIPFSYTAFLKKFIFIYTLTLPIGYVFVLKLWVIPVVLIIFYALASLELIAEEIENPFGTDPNDLPLDTICRGIRETVGEVI
jgi:ion channel-forming bestrophin family protein